MRVLIITVFWAALLLVPGHFTSWAHAEGGEDGAQPEPEQSAPAHLKSKKAPVKSEKETDGTTAANRFEADTVIKSQYKHEGEQLEVDPD
jgi:hypothetical protein